MMGVWKDGKCNRAGSSPNYIPVAWLISKLHYTALCIYCVPEADNPVVEDQVFWKNKFPPGEVNHCGFSSSLQIPLEQSNHQQGVFADIFPVEKRALLCHLATSVAYVSVCTAG